MEVMEISGTFFGKRNIFIRENAIVYRFQLEVLCRFGEIHCLQHGESESCSVMSDCLQPHGLYSPWNFPGQNTGVGILLLHCGQILYQLAKSLQSCLTLCDPIDGSPPGSPVPGILQARTLEWVALQHSHTKKVEFPKIMGQFYFALFHIVQWPLHIAFCLPQYLPYLESTVLYLAFVAQLALSCQSSLIQGSELWIPFLPGCVVTAYIFVISIWQNRIGLFPNKSFMFPHYRSSNRSKKKKKFYLEFFFRYSIENLILKF